MKSNLVRLLLASIVSFASLGFTNNGLPEAPVGTDPVSKSNTGMARSGLPHSVKRQNVLTIAEKVADHQIAMLAAGQVHPRNAADSTDPKGWVQGAFFIGLTHLADRSLKPQYREFLMARGESNRWELGRRLYHADDHAVGQAYLWAARNGAGQEAIAPMRKAFDLILAHPSQTDLAFVERPAGAGDPLCFDRWCWCDALFMSPPALVELSKATGDPRYAAFAKSEFWAVTDYLQDAQSSLYFRDSRFFERRGKDGEKIFWSRGNGWVFAGLANLLTHLPKSDPDQARFEGLFQTMAAKLASIQKTDGYWNASLLGAPKDTIQIRVQGSDEFWMHRKPEGAPPRAPSIRRGRRTGCRPAGRPRSCTGSGRARASVSVSTAATDGTAACRMTRKQQQSVPSITTCCARATDLTSRDTL